MTTVRITVKTIDGEPMIDAETMSLLFGVTSELITSHLGMAADGDRTSIPQQWIKAGRRRASEARAATGHSDLVSALEYWAAKDHGAELEIVYV